MEPGWFPNVLLGGAYRKPRISATTKATTTANESSHIAPQRMGRSSMKLMSFMLDSDQPAHQETSSLSAGLALASVLGFSMGFNIFLDR